MEANQKPTIVKNMNDVNCTTKKRKRVKIRRLVASPSNSVDKINENCETNGRLFLRKLKRLLFITLLSSVASAVLLGHHLTHNNTEQSSILQDFVSSYRRHYYQIIHGKPHYCDAKLDVQNILSRIHDQILHQEDAIQKLDSILRNETQLRSIAIVGPSGVGKTMTASALLSYFPWRENMWTYAWNTHVENEVEKFRILRMYVEQFTDCGRNLLIVDNLSPCDDAVIPLLNQMIATQDGANKKRVVVIYIFNLNSMLNSDLYQKQRDSLQNLPDTTTINFKSFNEKELKDCIRREVQTENLTITDADFEEIVATIDVATSGCKKVKSKVLVYGHRIDENIPNY
ncbi:uncharacterized protein LOC101453740 [Ceratitis capitata]|uniref:AAA+ ATPase domain-containing protein n=1 Tax=Ceratitis capitata TaxID=7213 RepID=W8C2V9_CERCA|nr:uncharacterized protein LOC101453740 [Ceratitis capitata]